MNVLTTSELLVGQTARQQINYTVPSLHMLAEGNDNNPLPLDNSLYA